MLLDLQAVPFVTITDHCALKYFTTKQLLNLWQARWANIVADYHFKITYCSGTANVVADALTRKHSKLITQKEKDIAAQIQLFLNPSCIIAAIGEGSANIESGSLNKAEQAENSYQLVDQILQANCSYKSLNQYCQMAGEEKQG